MTRIRRCTEGFGACLEDLVRVNASLRDRHGVDNVLKDLVRLRFNDSLKDWQGLDGTLKDLVRPLEILYDLCFFEGFIRI